MGGNSSLVENEKHTWISKDLLINEEQAQKQRPNLGFFTSDKLEILKRKNKYTLAGTSIVYFHYFIRDRATEWVIEFGGGGFANCTVRVHNDPQDTHVETTRVNLFDRTDDVMFRMAQVCGARGYSAMLRNCEHLVNYIAFENWHSTQTVGPDGGILAYFQKYAMALNNQNLNRSPTRKGKPLIESMLFECPAYTCTQQKY